MNTKIKELIAVSRKFGLNPAYIIAGGGNTSYKDEEKIWVKASGSSLADIDEDGFVCLEREKLKVLSTRTYSEDSSQREQEVKADLSRAILYPKGKRPSVETSMHEIIRFPFVVHTHPTLLNALLCGQNSREEVAKIFGEAVIYVPYTDPGYILFKAVEAALLDFRSRKGREPELIFLENHGVFVGGDSVAAIENHYEEIENKLSKLVSPIPETSEKEGDAKFDSAILALSEFDKTRQLFTLSLSHALCDFFVESKASFVKVSIPFTPDNIVYCKSNYLFLEDGADIIQEYLKFEQKHGYGPKVIAVEGAGILAIEESEHSARIVLDVFEDMMKVSLLTESFGGPRPMAQSQIDFIDNWEVENYRRKVSKGS